jgi:hypothetical protein
VRRVGVHRAVGRRPRDDAVLELLDPALDLGPDLRAQRLVLVVLLERQEPLVEEQRLLAVVLLAIRLRDVEEEGRVRPGLVGLGEEADRLLELAEVVVLLALVEELLGFLDLLVLGRLRLSRTRRQGHDRSGGGGDDREPADHPDETVLVRHG